MNPLEQQLLHAEAGPAAPRLQVRTSSRIDVGLWWRKRPIWLCLLDDEILLLAVGKRRYSERIAIRDCSQAHYTPSSSELVLTPDNALRHPRLKLPASTAMEILAHLNHNHSTHNTPTP